MRNLLVISLIVLTTNALALCPLKSYSLNNLASKARSLEKNFQKLTACYKDANIQAPVSDIMLAIQKLSYSFSGKEPPIDDGDGDGDGNGNGNGGWETIRSETDFTAYYGDQERINLGELQDDVQKAMEAFFQLSQLAKDQKQNAECSTASNNNNIWIGLIEVFNGFAPMAMASLSKGAPQLTPYLIGAQAVGSVVQQVLKSMQERKERYSMTSARKRSAFIDASCLYHDLALNTFVLDETLNTDGNYYESILNKAKKERDQKLKKTHDESKILAVLSQEFRDLSEDLGDFIDFEYAGDKTNPSDAVDDIINDGSDDGDYNDDEEDNGWDEDWYDDNEGGSGDYRQTYVCSALRKYFNERNFGISRGQRYKVFFTYMRKFLKDKKLRNSLVSYDINYEIFTDALNELRYGDGADCQVTHFERPLEFFQKQVKKSKEVLELSDELRSLPVSELKAYYNNLKDVSDLSYEVFLVQEKISFLQRIQEENIEVDLGEIYLLEQSINSQLVKSKKYSYAWLEFNSNRGVEYLHSFRKKYDLYKTKINSSRDKTKNCQLLSKLGRDYRVAENMRNRNILYCNIMYPFVNPVDHKEFTSLCQKHGIQEYKFEGTAAPTKKRRRWRLFPIFLRPVSPTSIYLGRSPAKSAVLTNLYSRYSSTYETVESLIERNQCGNQFDKTKLELE